MHEETVNKVSIRSIEAISIEGLRHILFSAMKQPALDRIPGLATRRGHTVLHHLLVHQVLAVHVGIPYLTDLCSIESIFHVGNDRKI